MSTATELAADVARAQRAHDALLAEQRDLPTKLARAGRGDAPEEWAYLAARQGRLPDEITDAATAVLRARLAERWVDAEAAAPEADQAHERFLAALAQYESFQNDHPRHMQPQKPGADLTAFLTQAGVVQEELDTARIAQQDAERAVLVALHDIQQLEDELEVASGIRPETIGTGLRAPVRTLARTFVCTSPTPGGKADAYCEGTVPPRWVAWKLRLNEVAFTDAPPWTATRPAQDPNSMLGETLEWAAPTDTDQADSPQNIAQYLASDSMFTHPEIEPGKDVFKPAARPKSTFAPDVGRRW